MYPEPARNFSQIKRSLIRKKTSQREKLRRAPEREARNTRRQQGLPAQGRVSLAPKSESDFERQSPGLLTKHPRPTTRRVREKVACRIVIQRRIADKKGQEADRRERIRSTAFLLSVSMSRASKRMLSPKKHNRKTKLSNSKCVEDTASARRLACSVDGESLPGPTCPTTETKSPAQREARRPAEQESKLGLAGQQRDE